ncbi:MAG: PH domain-containing protein [Actinobacteria bacterium]|nr:PH domain-containing protein [Actinomycetota bacterium]
MLQGRADQVVPAAAGGVADGDAPGRSRQARHLRRVGGGSWSDTDLSNLPAPPTPVADLPVPRGPRPPELAPDPGLDWWRKVNKRGTKHVATRLSRSETVKYMVRGTVSRRKGVLVLTSQRLLFVRDRGSGTSSIDFHLASVSSIAIERSASSSRIVIHCLGVVTEVYDVAHADAQAIVDEAQQILSYIRFPVVALKPRQVSKRPRHVAAAEPAPTSVAELPVEPEPEPAPTPPPAPPVALPPDPAGLLVAHLRELAELHRDGLLDDYEFAMAKGKLLR